MHGLAEPTIRSACKSDLDIVANVWHDSASHMDGASTPMPSRRELRDRIEVELQSDWDLYVAVRGNQIVGLLAIKTAEAILDQIFVSPKEQRRGVGRALLKFAKQAMPSGFTLRTTASNNRAGRFYEKEGLSYFEEGVHPQSGIPVRYYGWNARGE
jgi:GNAT superfamily N-acetyltransferase